MSESLPTEAPLVADAFGEAIHGKATEIVPAFVDALLAGKG